MTAEKAQRAPDRRRAGRPQAGARTLTRHAVGEAVIALLIAEGSPALSMSRIARKLGVRSQSLYHHVSGVTEAVNAARTVLMAQVDTKVLESAPWPESVGQFADSYFNTFWPLGAANGVFFDYGIADEVTLGVYARFVKCAGHAGFRGQRGLSLLFDIEYAVFAAILEASSLHKSFDEEALRAEEFAELRELLGHRDLTQQAARERVRERVCGLLI